MFYIDAKKLVDLSLEHEILHSHPDQPDTVFLTLDTDDGPQWALYDKESVIRLLMEDEEGQAVLRSALESKGVTFIPYEGSASDKQMPAIIANLKDKEEETTHV